MPRDLFAQPLFSPKLIKTRFPAQPLPEAHQQAIAGWAAQLKGGLGQVKEEAIRTSFLRLFFADVLGYTLVGYRRMFTQHLTNLPIPTSTAAQQVQLSALAEAAAQAASERLQTQRNFARRIHDLLPSTSRSPPKGAQTTLGEALSHWWLLADFKAFQCEVAKRFKADIPLKDRNDWEQWFSAERIRIHQLSANSAATERSIDEVVYTLFGLDAAEVALIERTVQR